MPASRRWKRSGETRRTTSMPNYSRGSVILVRFPFSDLTSSKVRPAIVVSAAHPSQDVLIVPLTSKTDQLQPGDFAMENWQAAGLNVPSAVKGDVFTIQQSLVIRTVGSISGSDERDLERSLRAGLGL
ncbi:MAG: type II toxin-antitoxin system PemK/MazF family toxin [Pyrinomonadaceae bacterium]